jgi:hypothetical protein
MERHHQRHGGESNTATGAQQRLLTIQWFRISSDGTSEIFRAQPIINA